MRDNVISETVGDENRKGGRKGKRKSEKERGRNIFYTSKENMN